jgi:Ser-tRNA(Ala) deacylase AlaX
VFQVWADYILKFKSCAKIEALMKTEKDNEVAVILDRTIFHPQGGGQPSDEGVIIT